MLAFFLSGLPGGLDYAMLAMVKHGYLSIEAEKRYNARVMVRERYPFFVTFVVTVCRQVWIRAPGCMLCAYTIYFSWRYRMVCTVK